MSNLHAFDYSVAWPNVLPYFNMILETPPTRGVNGQNIKCKASK